MKTRSKLITTETTTPSFSRAVPAWFSTGQPADTNRKFVSDAHSERSDNGRPGAKYGKPMRGQRETETRL
jgi:hypothetical protein